ncbi:hypothetical protein [Streptomyces sp. NPDC060322]|uniref:hypothetical protein n=1 Tax=Streptomyces sp. NPDC060322 TaxID=3347097 RepID=UPI003669F006
MSPRLRDFLKPRARRYAPTPADRIRRYATTVDDDGSEHPAETDIVDAMIRFEERYGGLCYAPRGGNDHEYGLFGHPTVHRTSHGSAFPGILDGSWTRRVDVLADGRTAMPIPGVAHRVIDRSIDQRLEADALLTGVHQWPHLVLHTTTGPGADPQVAEAHLPPRAHEATGPSDMWWFDGTSAVNLRLHRWWTTSRRDTWIVRCFVPDGDGLDRTAAAVRAAVPDLATAVDDWCSLCTRFIDPGRSCPGVTSTAKP